MLGVDVVGAYIAISLTRHAVDQVRVELDSPGLWYTVAGITGVIGFALAADALRRLWHLLRTWPRKAAE